MRLKRPTVRWFSNRFFWLNKVTRLMTKKNWIDFFKTYFEKPIFNRFLKTDFQSNFQNQFFNFEFFVLFYFFLSWQLGRFESIISAFRFWISTGMVSSPPPPPSFADIAPTWLEIHVTDYNFAWLVIVDETWRILIAKFVNSKWCWSW